MKLEDGEAIVDVQICTEKDDVLLTANGGQCIRFAVPDVRVFPGRASHSRIALAEKDHVVDVDPPPRRRVGRRGRYSCTSAPARSGAAPATRPESLPRLRRASRTSRLGEKRYVELSAAEQFVLTVSRRWSSTSTARPAAAAKALWP